MKFPLPALAVMLLGLPCLTQAQSYTPETFAQELTNLERAIDQSMADTLNGLPPAWDVNTGTHSYSISTEPLKTRLRESHSASAHDWIVRMRAHLQSFTVAESRAASNDLAALKSILARPEFKQVAPPNILQRWAQQAQAWIAEWLSRLFAFAAQHPTGSQVLFWTLIVGAVLALGFWLFNLWERADRIPSVPTPLSLEHKLLTWQEWLLAAREAAANGDHRQAIRSAYWAAIARLQHDRALRINLTDTPRERLRFLAQSTRKTTALPATQMEPLTRITTSLERHWYAKMPVNSDDVARTFENVEALGCKAD
jgi:hypothetical protein